MVNKQQDFIMGIEEDLSNKIDSVGNSVNSIGGGISDTINNFGFYFYSCWCWNDLFISK